MQVLVTGANGFLGSWLCRRLTERGDSVTCLLRPGASAAGLKDLPLRRVEGDITEPQTLAAAVGNAQVVFHLAGIRRGATREAFFRVNALGTRHICDALARAGGKRRLVLAGSLAASGPSEPGHPRREEDPFLPEEWYGESKAEAERIALDYQGRLGVTVARPPRILGPGDRENLVFFKLVQHGIRLELLGGPRPLSMVDVDDVVDGLLLLAEAPAAEGEAFFLSSPETLTFSEVQGFCAQALGVHPRSIPLAPWALKRVASGADLISRATGRHLPLNRKLARQLLAPAWTCSTEKAERLLGFRAKRGLPESIARSAAWYRAQGWLGASRRR